MRAKTDSGDTWSVSPGIRYGNPWRRSLADQLGNPRFVEDVALLAVAGLSLEPADSALELSERLPALCMIADHMPKALDARADRSRFRRIQQGFAARLQTHVKLSAVLLQRDGRVSYGIAD